MNLSDLAKPFPASSISWRVGSTNGDKTKGMALAYIDARDVMERLDDVCGHGGWQVIYTNAGNGKTCCQIGIKIDGEWVWKSNGAGETDFEADKGAFSDSFKRAGVLWGIGRYLYALELPWVAIEQRGKSYVIQKSEQEKLDAIIEHTVRVYIPRDVKNEFYNQAMDALSKGDADYVNTLWSEWKDDIDRKAILWSMFSSHQRSAMKSMKAGA
jgi:hypothetical protein